MERDIVSGIVRVITTAYHRVDYTDSLNVEDILENLPETDEEIIGGC